MEPQLRAGMMLVPRGGFILVSFCFLRSAIWHTVLNERKWHYISHTEYEEAKTDGWESVSMCAFCFHNEQTQGRDFRPF